MLDSFDLQPMPQAPKATRYPRGFPVFHSPWIHTMPRCALHRRSLLLSACALTLGTATSAQTASPTNRKFPATALRGILIFGAPPNVQLNGTATQLAPGARIRNVDNLMVLSGELTGRKAVVNYTTDLHGQPLDIWILTDAEKASQPWPTTAAQSQTWQFNADTQTWTRP